MYRAKQINRAETWRNVATWREKILISGIS